MHSVLVRGLFASGLFFGESVTVNDRLPRIFRKSAIGFGFFAEQKPRAFAGDDFPGE
jgi:hypothetical protein